MGKLNTAIKLLFTNPRMFLAQIVFLNHNRFSDDAFYLKLLFRLRLGYKLDLENPKTFNQKLQWLKLFDRRDIYTTMVDKFLVKQYVSERIGEEYIIPTLGTWSKTEDIDWESLPTQFVLKTNHDGGGSGIVICRDKNSLDKKKACEILQRSLNRDVFSDLREWPYQNVKRRIIAERFMTDGTNAPLKDYKVMCFNGKARTIQVHKGRFANHTQDFYNVKWEKEPFYQEPLNNSPEKEQKPNCLDKMIELSEILSENIPFVRVDWYIIEEKLYFGELTFYDASGFDEFVPEKYNEIIGGWIKLPQPSKL